MATEPKVKRISVKYKKPNPLFEKWITEWLEQAKVKDSKIQKVFKNALSTLKKYPLPLDTGRDCIMLHGFGKKLCDMLDKKLVEYKTNGGIVTHNTPDKSKHFDDYVNINDGVNRTEPKTSIISNNIILNAENSEMNINMIPEENLKSTKAKVYKPAKRSGAYAILLALLKYSQESTYVGYMTKAEIVEQAKDFCDKSFVKPDVGSYYTAWSSMATLVKKELVSRSNNPAKFSITDKGKACASQFLENDEDGIIPNNSEKVIVSSTDQVVNMPGYNSENNMHSSKTIKSSSDLNILTQPDKYSSQPCTPETIIFAPYTFDIILLVDTQETAG